MKNKSLPFLITVLALSTSGCSFDVNKDSESEYEPRIFDLYGEFEDDDYLTVEGTKIVNQNNETIYLHGINAGGYLVTESWMCASKLRHRNLEDGTTLNIDHLTLTNTLVRRFGEEKTLQIWDYWRENFWADHDFVNCKNMNMNVIRLPFSYMSVDPNYYNVPRIPGDEFNFDILDAFVEGAASHGLYVILDLHGAYGSQNGQDHSGQVIGSADQVDFYSNDEKKAKTVHLWEALAEHYKDIPSIAAYDLLNEPGEKAGSTEKRHWDFFDDMYKAIRRIDNKRPLIMESCWDGKDLPQPSTYLWNNVIYSFHNYSGIYNAEENVQNYTNKINGVKAQNFNVPYYMGEFNLYNDENSWKLVLPYMTSNNWHWTSWTYKLNRLDDSKYGGWGIYYTQVENIYFDVDDFDTIMEKIYELDTTCDNVTKMTFDSSVTLETIMRNYC